MSDNAPITEELRDAMQRYDNFDGTSRVVLGESNFDRLCDAIDATHANLERENVKLRKIAHDVALPLSIACDMFNIRCCECAFTRAKTCPVPELEEQLKELGIEANDG